MSSREIYLDHATTTPVDPIVADTMARIQTRCFANPSSPHAAARRAYQKLALYGLKNRAPTAFGMQPSP